MLEMIERLLAALIIVGMLGIVIFLALDRGDGAGRTDIVQTPPASPVQRAPRESRETIAEPRPNPPRDDLEPGRKLYADRLPSSSSMEMRRERGSAHRAYTPYRERQREIITHADYRSGYRRDRDPWRAVEQYECPNGICGCDCDRPYWTSAGPVCPY